MKIYEVDGDYDNFDACVIDFDGFAKKYNCHTYDGLFELDGTSKSENWLIRTMDRFYESPLGDYVSNLGGDVMILRKEAIEKLRFLMGNVEILPLDCDFGDYWAINVLDVLDCLDYEKSVYDIFDYETIDGRPRIMVPEEIVFIPESIRGYHMFKMMDVPKSYIFVDEVFVEEVNKQGVTGFEFHLVWEE